MELPIGNVTCLLAGAISQLLRPLLNGLEYRKFSVISTSARRKTRPVAVASGLALCHATPRPTIG